MDKRKNAENFSDNELEQIYLKEQINHASGMSSDFLNHFNIILTIKGSTQEEFNQVKKIGIIDSLFSQKPTYEEYTQDLIKQDLIKQGYTNIDLIQFAKPDRLKAVNEIIKEWNKIEYYDIQYTDTDKINKFIRLYDELQKLIRE